MPISASPERVILQENGRNHPFSGCDQLPWSRSFSTLIGVFAVCGFALHNHMLLNIGIKLTVGQSISYFAQWLVVGIVINLIYAPPTVR